MSNPRQTGLVLTATVLAVGAASWHILGTARDVRVSAAVARSRAPSAVELVLDELKRTWSPNARARLVAEAKRNLDGLQAGLLAVLGRPGHRLLAEAIELVAALGLRDARPLLLQLVEQAPRRLRPHVVAAVGQLGPWQRDELLALFASQDPAVRAASATACAAAPEGVLVELFGLLGDPEDLVREAALDALPPDVPEAARRELLELARVAEGRSAVWLLRAVGRIGIDESGEALLGEQLDGEDATIRAAALDALTHKRSPLRNKDRVWALACDASTPVEQARALLCLERTGSFSAKDVRGLMPALDHPLPRLFAARCLLAARDPEGVEALLAIVEEEALAQQGAAEQESVLTAARKLLAEVSGTAPSDGPTVWREWLQDVKELPDPRLREPEGVLPPFVQRTDGA